LINSLTLGKKSFPVNIIQGPLAGFSSAPFRELTWRYGKPAFSCTEMISAKTLINKPLFAQRRFLAKDPNEGPVCFQLSGNDEGELSKAVKIATDYGADLIDLNCGCPVKKIRKKGTGSGLLSTPLKIFALIAAMKNSTHVPVSVKIRVDGGSSDNFNAEIATMLNDSGVDFVTVHGRHWTEHYETQCNYDEIKFFVENLNMPVIGNGDIASVSTLENMFATGCAGVMIARAGVGQPWLIQELITKYSNQKFIKPSLEEISGIFLEHVEKLALLLQSEKHAIIQSRKFAKYYARDLAKRAELCNKVNVCESFVELKKVVKNCWG